MEVKTVYTSSDGFEFSSEEKCREHEENKIKMEKQKKRNESYLQRSSSVLAGRF